MNPADVPDLEALFWCNLLMSMILATIIVVGIHAWRLSKRDEQSK